MSYNGSGTFTINSTGQPVVAGTVITASAFNALTADLATGLTTAITKDGQTTTTARIPFAQGINSSLVTDSSSTSTGSIITAGGVGIAKALYVGTTANVAGAVTLGGIATFSAQPIFSSLTASSAVATDASKGLVSVTNTGTGNNVLATSPTITTPTISSLSSASATALTLQSAGTTAITVDTSQNVGIGTTSPDYKFVVADTSNVINAMKNNSSVTSGSRGNLLMENSSGSNVGRITFGAVTDNVGTEIQFYTRPAAGSLTQTMTLDSTGNLGIGTTSINSGWNIQAGTTSAIIGIGGNPSSNGTGRLKFINSNTVKNWQISTNDNVGGALEFTQSTAAGGSTFTTPSMLIDSNGNLLVGTTSYFNGTICPIQASSSSPNQVLALRNTNANPFGIYINYSTATPNTTGLQFIYCNDATALRMEVRSNGGIANYSANNVNLSDRREKTNFAPAKAYLDIVCNIPVQTFNYIDQNMETDGGLTLGVVAQDVQAVAPELVMESNWANKEEDPKMRLSIYQTDLQYALMKSIQELKAINDTQAETINALTARIVALESK